MYRNSARAQMVQYARRAIVPGAQKEALIHQCAYVRLYTCTRIHLLYLYDCTRVHVPVITCYDVLGQRACNSNTKVRTCVQRAVLCVDN